MGLKFLFGFLISSALEVDKHGIVDIVYVERKKAVTGLNIDAVIIWMEQYKKTIFFYENGIKFETLTSLSYVERHAYLIWGQGAGQ